MFRYQTRPFQSNDAGMNFEQIIEPGGPVVIERAAPDDKQNPIRVAHAAVIDAGGAHHFGARTLDEF